MGALEKTKELCKQRNVTIRTLENDLGFGNGYIGSKTKDNLPFDRVVAIADYFHVPIGYFLETGHPDDEERIAEALRLYDAYAHALPEIQNAIESLLKPRSDA